MCRGYLHTSIANSSLFPVPNKILQRILSTGSCVQTQSLRHRFAVQDLAAVTVLQVMKTVTTGVDVNLLKSVRVCEDLSVLYSESAYFIPYHTFV